MNKEETVIILFGPTAVGKTSISLKLAKEVSGQIINADVGQFYTPLSIGTAKPDWQAADIPHHLFDVINKPEDLTVARYRQLATNTASDIMHNHDVPIVVGGSGFYVQSLLFEPMSQKRGKRDNYKEPLSPSWHTLHAIDPIRAGEIHPHDTYRINRALTIWQQTGILPSMYKPQFKPIAPVVLVILMRDRQELYQRIEQRVDEMIHKGWIQEVEALMDTAWIPFLYRKKFIGYPDIIDYLAGKGAKTINGLIAAIAKKTCNYAKRQIIFARMLQKKIQPYTLDQMKRVSLITINLSSITDDKAIQEIKQSRLHL